MKNLFKLLSIVVLAALLIGCTTASADKAQANSTTNQTMTCSGKFNEESYIWQSFLFPTNRTSGVQ
jgi:outer membrane PBP1 activator LpoA protein